MIPRSLIPTLCLSFCILIAHAQQDTIAYFKNDGRQVNIRDSADYYRVLNWHKGDTVVFTEYRKNGMWVKASARGSIAHPVYNGYVNLYYKNGKPAEMHDYTNGMATKTLRYYPNGTLQQTIIYKQEDGWPRERLLYEADSAGNININRGNGTHKDINIFTTGDITEYYTMEGPFKLGAKDGLWKGKNNWGTTFEETYDRGKLLSGISKGANGRTYHYTHKFEYPAYKNGRIRFEDFIFTRMKHPADTAGLIMTSAHRLKLSYTIDETGKPVAFRGYRADNNTEVYLDMRLGLPRCTAATLRGVPISYPVIYNHSIPDINMKIMWNESIQPPATNAKSPFNTNTYLNGTLR